MGTTPLFDFNRNAPLDNWVVIEDGVMGGRSRGSLRLDGEGHGLFSGKVSLENNGGFASIRLDCGRVPLSDAHAVVLQVKGDGKRYQFRIRASKRDAHAYIHYFETNGDWEQISLPLHAFYPTFRGRKLELPNFASDSLEEIGILIGNQRQEYFELRIKSIWLETD